MPYPPPLYSSSSFPISTAVTHLEWLVIDWDGGGVRMGEGKRKGLDRRVWDGKGWDRRVWNRRIWDIRIWDMRVCDRKVWDKRVWDKNEMCKKVDTGWNRRTKKEN